MKSYVSTLMVWKNKFIPLLLLRPSLLGIPTSSFKICSKSCQYNRYHHVLPNIPPRPLYGFVPFARHDKSVLPQRQSHYRLYETKSDAGDQYGDPTQLARSIFSKLANRGKSWQRLGPMIEMAYCPSWEVQDDGRLQRDRRGTILVSSLDETVTDPQRQVKSIVDIGCDHGLLAIGLAASGCFQKVLGVDVSEPALENGAHLLLREFQREMEVLKQNASDTTIKSTTILRSSLEFRVGDGLQGLKPGEADAICLAGIGFQTMIRILTTHASEDILRRLPPHNNTTSPIFQLDQLKCQELYLQPANSKPVYLMELYGILQDMGWQVANEHISEISSRWYMTTKFVRCHERKPPYVARHENYDSSDSAAPSLKELPGCRLEAVEPSHPMKQHYQNYVAHHLEWLTSDWAKKGRLDDDEMRWFDTQKVTRKTRETEVRRS